jgi:membrane fusion protein (multidrug efflux system)
MNAMKPIPRKAIDEAEPLGDSRPAQGAKRGRRWPWVILLLVLAAAGAGYAYRDRLIPQEAAPIAAAPAEVVMRLNRLEVMTLAPAVLQETVKVSGSLAPAQQTTVTSQIAGRIEAIGVRPGDAVEAGSVIARLDTADLQTRIAQQEAAIAATQAQLDLANRQLESTKSLADKGLASPSALESAQSNANAMSANLAAQQAQLAGIRLSLDNAVITAPFAGIIAARNVEPGQTIGAGSVVASLVDLSTMEARVLAPLSAAAALRLGQEAQLSVEGFRGRAFDGDISRISPVAVDNTRSIQLYLSLDNEDGLLRGGMFVTGAIVLDSQADAVAVPAAALRRDADGDYLLSVQDGRLVRSPVTPGRSWHDGRLVEVDRSLAGTVIVSAPLPTLQAGMPVTVEE